MSHLFWLDQERLDRIKHMFPKPRGVPRVDDRRVLSGIIHVIRNGLRWRDAPSGYRLDKTLYNHWARWSQMGVFARILTELAAQGDETGTLMIDATHLKTHRTASSVGPKKGGAAAYWPYQGWAELETPCRNRCGGSCNSAVQDGGKRQRLNRSTGTFAPTTCCGLHVSG